MFKSRDPIIVAAAAAFVVAGVIPKVYGQVPAYNIYPYAQVPTATGSAYPIFGSGISNDGTFASGLNYSSGSFSNGVLYNVSSGTSISQSQSGVIYGRSTQETTGVPYSANNNGVMFGSSGAGSIVQLGQPTVWQSGQAYALPVPQFSGAGQAYGSNNLNQAVGVVGSPTGGLNQAAIFFWGGSTSSPNTYSADLNELTPAGYTLNTAYGINDAGQIVGQANQQNLGAGYVPFILNLGRGDTQATVIPGPTAAYNGGEAFAISSNGLVTGGYSANYSNGVAFIYNSSSGTTVGLPSVIGSSGGSGRGINSKGQVVGTGSNAYAVPFLYDGSNSWDVSNLPVNNQSGSWHISDNTSSGAFGIADNGNIVGRAMYNGVLTAFVMVPTGATLVAPQYLTFNNAGGTGDGTTWDTSQANFNSGTAPAVFSSVDSDNVTFTDANNGHYNVSIPVTVTPGSVTFSNSLGNYVISGPGGIGGNGRGNAIFTKSGAGSVTLNTVNTYFGLTNVYGGSLILGISGALPAGTNLSINGNNSSVVFGSAGKGYAQVLGSLGLYNSSTSSMTVDLMNNDLDIRSGSIATINALLKNGYNGGLWNGVANTGAIISSSAGAANSLMAPGAIVNDNKLGTKTPYYGVNGTIAASFAGAVPLDGDILIKYTYYGDANLDAKVDGSDYSLIDSSFASESGTNTSITGWYNGDFNYDGTVDGSDYTLIDNAYNSQGAVITAQVASSLAQTAVTSVPEPVSLGALGAVGITLFSSPPPGFSTGLKRAGLSFVIADPER